jgi:hypothetical protein
MSSKKSPPEFSEFARWLASGSAEMLSSSKGGDVSSHRYAKLEATAREARDQFLLAREAARTGTASKNAHLEVLQLLAAADKSEAERPPELTTPRGFRVTLAYDEGSSTEAPSICVLVRCPESLIAQVQGQTAYLWNGSERFELGQFDSEGKAIGTLPVGVQISSSDLSTGRIKLEEPPPGTDR